MTWGDCDFILEGPEHEPGRSSELTGWETVVFELEDEETAED
ncbi:MAG TPA: hypothetical protein VNA04_06910 [Thermoanaerobaculia bacterium]|nr:hypothetical protein [Thermoanaerobaculia bacterium]